MSGHWVKEAASDWTKYTGGYANFGYLGRHLGPVVDAEGWDVVRPAWQRFLRETESRFVSAPYFARSFGQWKNVKPGLRLLTADELDERAGIPLRRDKAS